MKLSFPLSSSLQHQGKPRGLGSVLFAFIFGVVVSPRLMGGQPNAISVSSDTNLRRSVEETHHDVHTSLRESEEKSGISFGANTKERLLTLREMKENFQLPCNFVHDGYYIKESNTVLHQNYLTLTQDSRLEDDDIPVMVEVGGHDGITKSISLKSSRCLNVNTLLIEATPSTYNTLKNTRAYDHTVNAALCEQESIQMEENAKNTGQNKVSTSSSSGSSSGVSVPCTTIDKELDKLAQAHNANPEKIKLVFLVLDVEGYEHVAIRGLQKYSPLKADIEIKYLENAEKEQFEAWQKKHNLVATNCYKGWSQDQCFNYDSTLENSFNMEETKKLLYGARKAAPAHTWRTQDVIPAYFYYGEE